MLMPGANLPAGAAVWDMPAALVGRSPQGEGGIHHHRVPGHSMHWSRLDPMMATSLVPLSCPACDALVPLVNAGSTTCPYCGAKVDVPAAYQQHKASLVA